ncbi:MAG: tRNA(Met) cytidine acetyltransferase TmcA domain-containing protein, partial [Gammaproteobacteria bacterium]|nr:tRNA(Met) cytidine acetyltransferase TmcA domain-containing protein [Gammaproteobacteria bacterium]
MTGHPYPDAPVRLAAALRAAARARDQRRLVVLAGPRRWSGETAVAMLDDAPRAWIGARAVDGGACVPAAKARGLLGGEWAQAVFDAHDGLDVEALAAVAGTLRGGGLLLLLTPPLDAWPSRPDPALARLLSSPATPADAVPRFVTRLVRQIRADPAIAVCTPGAVAPAPAPPIGGAPPERRAGPDGCLGEDQRRAVRAVVEAVDGTPAVLTADRGRGKSAALGLGAARLLAGRPCRIVVTAPRRSAADAVFRHAARRLGLAPARGDLRLGAGRELR